MWWDLRLLKRDAPRHNFDRFSKYYLYNKVLEISHRQSKTPDPKTQTREINFRDTHLIFK